MINVDSSFNVAGELVAAREAARMLGVKLETLYAYASRGLVRSVGSSRTEGHAYRREDLERLLLRKRARSGHAATAASAMRWGEPIVDTAISAIDPKRGPIYRGHAAVDLAARG
ncbi:MAG: citrate synthase, partial [Polyangiaceae bacterium]